jgi:plasmid stability protein
MREVDEVTRQLRDRLAAGQEWHEGDPFPTFDELQDEFPALTNVYRVREALRPLNEDGLLETRHGSGTRVLRLTAAPGAAAGPVRLTTDIPASLHEKLQAAAARHHRSVRDEALALIEHALAPDPAQPAAVLSEHLARPGRRAIVIADLSQLRGPAGGKVILPQRLSWSPAGRVWDLDDDGVRQEMYKTVLIESIRAAELAAWINGPQLVEDWPGMFLPRGVRRAWEDIHGDVLHDRPLREPAA